MNKTMSSIFGNNSQPQGNKSSSQIVTFESNRIHPEPTKRNFFTVLKSLVRNPRSLPNGKKENDSSINEPCSNESSSNRGAENYFGCSDCQDKVTDLLVDSCSLGRLDKVIQKQKKSTDSTTVTHLKISKLKSIDFNYRYFDQERLYKEVAMRIHTIAGDYSRCITRISRDEYFIILKSSLSECESLSKHLITSLAWPYLIDNIKVIISTNIGYARLDSTIGNIHDLLNCTSIAVSNARQLGGNKCSRYDPIMMAEHKYKCHLNVRLEKAVRARKLDVLYQPIFLVSTGKIIGFESLCRFKDNELYDVPTEEIISLAEESDLIHQVDLFVLDKTCAQLQKWHQVGLDIYGSVNFCPRYFSSLISVKKILDISGRYEICPGRIKIELTERVFRDSDIRKVKECLSVLNDNGINIYIDDFGTGYSSLSYFLELSHLIHKVKIDKEFVADINSDKYAQSIVKTIVNMANSLGMQVITEGVETHDQLYHLEKIGCHLAQGYLIEKPMSAEQFESKYFFKSNAKP